MEALTWRNEGEIANRRLMGSIKLSLKISAPQRLIFFLIKRNFCEAQIRCIINHILPIGAIGPRSVE